MKRASRNQKSSVQMTEELTVPTVEIPVATEATETIELEATDISKMSPVEFDAEIAAVLARRAEKAAEKAAKSAANKATKESSGGTTSRSPRAKADKPEAGSKVEKAMQLAARSCGVTPDELNEQIVWKGAPWKWLFHNPKGNGWTQRFGYNFRAEKDGKAVVYYVTKKAEALTETAAA